MKGKHLNRNIKSIYSSAYNDHENLKGDYINDISNKRHLSPPANNVHFGEDNRLKHDMGPTQKIYQTISKTFTPTSSFMNRSLSFKDGANNLVKTKKLGNDLVHNIHHISDAGSSEDDEEDEASMSIFAALNNKADGHISDPQSNKVNFDFTNMKENSINNSMDNKKSLNFNFDQNLHSPGLNHSIFRNRQETNAYKRAEQSLQRMRSRKRSKPKFSFSTVSSSTGGYLSSNIFTEQQHQITINSTFNSK